ncbi:MAG: hypothetical protein Q4D16_23300 [Eubacteriales bacterium]|nr:hypothetical protein [Eubacteriales bacterium]
MRTKEIKNRAAKGLAMGMAVSLTVLNSLTVSAMYTPEQNGPDSEFAVYNDLGAHQGLDGETKNADIKEIFNDKYQEDYINAGAYILSKTPTASKEYEEGGIYYEADTFEYGEGIYIIIQDESSPDKFYTLIKSAQDLSVGESYIYRDGDIGGRLLDDKYTSTHMAGSYLDSDYSYVSYDTSGGKLSAQEVALQDDGTPAQEQAEGFTYLYLVSETPADYCQRTANEEAGLEEKAQSEERAYMPVNNTHQEEGEAFNNWTNLTEDDPKDYNDRIVRVGSTEGNSNSRLYSYSGQNVIVAKFAVGITEGSAELTWSDTPDYDENTDYSISSGDIEITAGETAPLYFHTQFTSTWGRDGYVNSDITYTIGDDSIISYAGKSEEEGAEEFVLTGLKAGTTTLTATVNDSEGKYSGGAEVTLNVTVK